jgi:hypothetical protein
MFISSNIHEVWHKCPISLSVIDMLWDFLSPVDVPASSEDFSVKIIPVELFNSCLFGDLLLFWRVFITLAGLGCGRSIRRRSNILKKLLFYVASLDA